MREYNFIIDKKRIPNNVIITITNNRSSKDMIHDIIYADHSKAFDKISLCPIQLPIPATEKQADYFYKKLKWLSTKKGYKASYYYAYKYWIDSYSGMEADDE